MKFFIMCSDTEVLVIKEHFLLQDVCWA